MKKTDFAMIILIASISVGTAYAVVSAIPGLKPSGESVKVKTIEKYTTQLDDPNPDVFNKEAINPTVDVTIGATGDSSQEQTNGDSESTSTAPDSGTDTGTGTGTGADTSADSGTTPANGQ